MKKILKSVVVLSLMGYVTYTYVMDGNPYKDNKETQKQEEVIEADVEHIDLYQLEPTKENMYFVCQYLGVKYPDIVTAQAVLESGHFKSNIFKKSNNPFGLYNSSTRRFYKFNHWVDSVREYMNLVEYKFNGHTKNEYYSFLKTLPYAEDTKYINKLKSIAKNIEK